MKTLSRTLCLAALLMPVLANAQEAAAPAPAPTKETIVCALDPTCNKPIAPPTRHRRGLTVSGQTAEAPPPAINLNIPFEYNSAELAADARITLDTLGAAMRDQRLAGFTFLIGGHTDAKGGDVYNQKLSERRADSVRGYLVAHFGIAPETLSVKGFGRSEPLDPAHPDDGVNRRVQIINTTAATARQ
jgi:outer membrane protein OmpA-like peptidoglycan-associated protein